MSDPNCYLELELEEPPLTPEPKSKSDRTEKFEDSKLNYEIDLSISNITMNI
jgi:hypothetical protein